MVLQRLLARLKLPVSGVKHTQCIEGTAVAQSSQLGNALVSCFDLILHAKCWLNFVGSRAGSASVAAQPACSSHVEPATLEPPRRC